MKINLVRKHNKELGKRLRIIRNALGLTIEHCGSIIGVGSRQWQKYESGESSISAVKLVTFCNTTSTPIGHLINHTVGKQ